ncbi:MAG: sacsin N-terminal ATP-binding-like domain-containing protein [Promethearchaeota archaeon]
MENYLDNWLNKSEEERKNIIKDNLSNLKYDVLKYLEENPSNFRSLIDLYKGMEFIKEDLEPYIVGKIIELTSEINQFLINSRDSNKKAEFYNDLLKQEIPEFIHFLFCSADDDLINNPKSLSLLFKASNSLFDSAILENALKISTEQYPDEWHFFFELIQNSRDAQSNKIFMEKLEFNDERSFLIYANDGDKFNPMDIWGIISLGQGAKNRLKNIGYFGIGFKSVSLVSNSVIIVSKPVQFRLNFNYGDQRRKYIEWDFESDSHWNFLENNNLLSRYSDFNNFFILENFENRKFEELFEHIRNIDPIFMLFLTPLEYACIFEKELNSNNVEDFFNLSEEEYEKSLHDSQVVRIGKKNYIIYTLFEKLVLTDDNNMEIGKREVRIAFNINKISDKEFQVKKHDSKFDLYAYFPVFNNNPGFHFIFHGHFILTSSREELFLNAGKDEWKKELNNILIKDKGAKCFLELYDQLANLKFSIKGLLNIFPFRDIPEDKKPNEIYIYKAFQEGLKKYLQDDYKEIPFWWDENCSKYICFTDVIFIQDKQASKVLKFLQKNLKTTFISLINDFSELNFNTDIYICDNKDKIDFCRSIFSDFDDRNFDSNKCFELIIMILNRLDSKIESDFVSINKWEGYFSSPEVLEEFRKVLMEWNYLHPENGILDIFQCFLIILKDCSGNKYYTRARYENYFYIEQELFNNYGEIFELLKKIELKSPQTELPLFIPEEYEGEYKDEDNLFYQCGSFNIYSILDIRNFNKIAGENKEVFNLYLRLIEKVFQNLLENINSQDNKGFNELYELFSGNDSRNYRESRIFCELILKLLDQPLFQGTREPDCFFNLLWGDPKYLKLFAETPVSEMFNIINLRLYDFSKLILKIISEYIKYAEFKDYRNKINNYNLSYKTIKNKINTVKNLLNNKSINDLREYLNQNKYNQNNYIISYYTDEKIFNNFFRYFYLDDSQITDLRYIIHLSKIYTPSRFQILEIKNDFRIFPIIELQENISESEYKSIKELFSTIKGKKYHWIHKEDLIEFKRNLNIQLKRKSILDLLKSIIKKLNRSKSENEDHWKKFYEFLLEYYKSLGTEQQAEFINQYEDYCKKEGLNHKVINNEKELVGTQKIYPNNTFEIQAFLFEQIVSHQSFQKYRLRSDQRDLWNSLENARLIFKKMDIKSFLKKILNSINDLKIFYKELAPKKENGENLSFIEFYKLFLLVLRDSGLKIRDLREYKLIPTLTFKFFKINQLPKAINFLYFDDGLKFYPFGELIEKCENLEQSSKLFDNWIAPSYYYIFENIFSKDSLKKSKRFPLAIKDWFLNPDLKNKVCIRELPIFLNLTLIEYYFKYQRFELEKDLQIIKNSLSFLVLTGIEKNLFLNFIKYLENLENKENLNIKNEFRYILSKFEIYPYEIDGEWHLTNLKNPNLSYRKNKIPDFFSQIINTSDFVYLHHEIEELLENSKLGFDFLEPQRPISLSLIYERFQHLLDPNYENFNIDQHKKLINYLFQDNNFNYYYSNSIEKSYLKEIIRQLKLKSYNREFQDPSNLFHPRFFNEIFSSLWNILTSLEKEVLKNSKVINTIDLKFYNLQSLPFKESKQIEDILIFKDELNRIEGLDLIIEILLEIKEKIKNPQTIINNFSKNLSRYFNHLYFKEDREIDRERLTEISLKFLENLYIFSKEINPDNFNKFLLTREQYRNCRILFDDDEVFTINNSPNFRSLREMINSNQDFTNLNDELMFEFFESKKIFFTIQNSLTLQMIERKIFELDNQKRQIIEALDYLLNTNKFKKIFTSQKLREYKENYFNILNKEWINIGSKLYPLKNLYLKSRDLDFKFNFIKEYAYFDDFCSEQRISLKDIECFTDFFEIKPITLDDLIYILDEFAQNPYTNTNKNKIKELMLYLTKEDIINTSINKLIKRKVIPVYNINNDNYEVFSLNELLELENVFLSSKEYIIEQFLKEWKKAREFQVNFARLLFHKKNSAYLNSWKKILEKMLIKANKNLNLVSIEEYPIPSIDDKEVLEGEEPHEQYINEVIFLRNILSFLQNESTSNTLKPLKFGKIKLDCLKKKYQIQRINELSGNLFIPNFIGKDIQISNVKISKFFNIRKDGIIQYYGLAKCGLREYFYRYLYDNIFPKRDKDESQINKELVEFEKIFQWQEDRDKFIDRTSGEVNNEQLRDFLIKLQNLELKPKEEETQDSLKEYLDVFLKWIEELIKIIKNTQEDFSDSCSNTELLKLLNFIRKNLKIKDKNFKIPWTKVQIGVN